MFKQATKATSQVQPTVATAAVKGEREETLHAEYSSASSVYSWHHFGSLPIQANAAPAVIQPKLTINQPNDPYEQEADRIANWVMNMPDSNMPGQLRSASTIQRKDAAYAAEEENENTITRKTTGNGGFEASPSLSNQLKQTKGNGTPLSATTRNTMENAFQTDFSRVRVHTDVQAAEMSQGIHARAFTHGQDIYFNRGEFSPETYEGKKLLAHELTHTLQQGGKIGMKIIQRASEGEEQPGNPRFYQGSEGDLDLRTSPPKLKINELKIPDVKLPFTPAILTTPIRTEDRPTDQRTIWRKHGANPRQTLIPKIQAAATPGGKKIERGVTYYFFKPKFGANQYVTGTAENIADALIIPVWSKAGMPVTFDVDHKREYQFGGEHDINNFWLLESAANQDSGRKIYREVIAGVGTVLDASSKGSNKVWKRKPSSRHAYKNYEITIFRIRGGLNIRGNSSLNYNKEEIFNDGAPLQGLSPLTEAEIDRLAGSASELSIFVGDRMSEVKKVNPQNPATPNWFKGFSLTEVANLKLGALPGEKMGDLRGKFVKKRKGVEYDADKYIDIPFTRVPGLPYTGKLQTNDLKGGLVGLFSFSSLSPIRVVEAALDAQRGLVITGKILPTIPIISEADIGIVFDGEDVYLEKTFKSGEFKVPSPFKIEDTSLTLRVGTVGLEIEGNVDFGIERVGSGSLTGMVNSRGEFGVRGNFDFDKNLFDNARIEVAYENRQWSVTGSIQIPRNKVRGIKNASATIAYTEGNLSAAGTVEPDIKGVKEGSFELKYSDTQFLVSGKLQLNNEIPRLKKGEINVSLEKNPESNYLLKGNGSAEFDIPGLTTSEVNIQYDNGILTIGGNLGFEKGMAKGDIKIGATNRPIDAQGNPSGEPGDHWTIYGNGSLTLKITKWLQATARVKFLPNGEMEVLGRVELPGTVEVFPRKEIDRKLFSMPTIEIPLFAIPLGPRSLGLVAQINGGLDFKAGIGPGQIQQLYGEIKYNPSRPDETTLSGGGRFVIPADAGLKLHADLTLGLSAAIASITGGVEIAGTAGLQGEAAASVNLNWSKASGLELFAEGSIKASPKFKFDANLLARAKPDLYMFELSKEWRHNLASFEWGPGIELGLKFPIRYKDGQEFKLSFEDIQVIRPDIDISAMATGVAGKFKDIF
jgi:hypothetical protein